eukprot:scaffold407_cov142-Skeletonema_menzelii.AAC.2
MSGNFLPGINRRYLGSFVGLFHAVSSVAALVIGNYLFLQCFLLGNDILASSEVDNSSLLPTIFHVTTGASGILLFFFWKSIQSYQHSTTSLKDKGLTAKQMQNTNRARGCVALILCAVYPLMYRYLPNETLQDVVISKAVAVVVVAVCVWMYNVFKYYGKGLFVLYSGTRFGFSLQVLFTGSLYSVRQSYPYIVNFLEKEALLISCCVEFGFLLYYLESRRLVSVQTVKDGCKRYHPILFYVFSGTMLKEKFFRRLPMSVSWATFLECILVCLFLKAMIKGIITTVVDKLRSKKESGDRREVFAKKQRSKSVFDVTSSTGRRSSIFESVDFGELSSSLNNSSSRGFRMGSVKEE